MASMVRLFGVLVLVDRHGLFGVVCQELHHSIYGKPLISVSAPSEHVASLVYVVSGHATTIADR